MIISIIESILIISTDIPTYNCYILPVIRHEEMMYKIYRFDKLLKK